MLNETGSPYATIGFEVSDGTAFSAATYTLTATVTAVNDAPTSTNDAVTTAEDTPLVLALTDFGTYADVEGTPLAAVRISALATDGQLQYDTTGTGAWAAVTLNQVISAADITAGRLRFAPDLNETGSPYATIGFQVSDGAAFSAATYTLTATVTAVNDAPTSTNDAVTTAEDTPLVLALTDFGTYADVEGTPLAAVRISALATDGQLQYDTTGTGTWAAVTFNQVISAADITAGRLRFAPDAERDRQPLRHHRLPGLRRHRLQRRHLHAHRHRHRGERCAHLDQRRGHHRRGHAPGARAHRLWHLRRCRRHPARRGAHQRARHRRPAPVRHHRHRRLGRGHLEPGDQRRRHHRRAPALRPRC